MGKNKLKYIKPLSVNLGEVAAVLGAACTNGNRAYPCLKGELATPECTTGSTPIAPCTNGSNANNSCLRGTSANNGCGTGTNGGPMAALSRV
jgi:hypothetical protein